jgi:repressor LexA
MAKGLTKRQLEVAKFISAFIEEHGYPPTIRDIAKHFKFSPKGAHDHVRALERKGILRKEPSKPRMIEIISEKFMPAPKGTIRIPLLSEIKGRFEEELYKVEKYVSISKDVILKDEDQKGNIFAIRSPNKLPDQGIFAGDIVIVNDKAKPKDGDLVVVLEGKKPAVGVYKAGEKPVVEFPRKPAVQVQRTNFLGVGIGVLRIF